MSNIIQPSRSTSNGERPDVAAAVARLRVRSGIGAALRSLSRHLEPDEVVLRVAKANRPALLSKLGLLVLTDRRVLFLWAGLIRESHESVPLDLMTGVALNKGFARSKIKTQGAQAMEEVVDVNHHDAADFVQALRGLLNERSAARPGASMFAGVASETVGGEDVLSQISQLKQLLDSGAITDGEYESKKAELLARL